MNPEDAWNNIDPLGEALHFLRMSGTFYCRSELSAPWGLEMPPMKDCLMFHFVTSGSCWLEAGTRRCRLHQGSLALVPHGMGHVLLSEIGAVPARLFDLHRENLSERYEILRHGDGGAAMTLICGAVRFDHPAAHRLLMLLPELIVVSASSSPDEDGIRSVLRLMAAEAAAMRPGGETIVTRLADILVIQAIRSWIERDSDARTGWLGALQDRQIGRALSLVHRDPARAWTLASLAEEAAMSRSAFAARFKALVGVPPMHYVAQWRMNLAASQLRERSEGLASLAGRLGYQSEAAFSRAFKRFMGVPPGAIQQAAARAGGNDVQSLAEQGGRRG